MAVSEFLIRQYCLAMYAYFGFRIPAVWRNTILVTLATGLAFGCSVGAHTRRGFSLLRERRIRRGRGWLQHDECVALMNRGIRCVL